MKVIIGLGNPGKEYENTRHNVGFMVLDELAEVLGVQFAHSKKTFSETVKLGNKVLLCKPQTFMNRSGQAVRSVLDFFTISLPSDKDQDSDIFVVHDDLDLALGSIKFQLGVGPKSHNGLRSIYEHLGTHHFWHVRVGVDNRGELRNSIVPSEYVLQSFSIEEQPVIESSISKVLAELRSKIDC